MKIVKLDRLAGLVAALLLVCIASPLFAADGNALIEAARKGDTAAVRQLLAAGADVNARDDSGWTALMEAASEGHTDTVKALIAAGANVNAQTNSGGTALSLAIQDRHTEIANILRNAGAR